MMGKFYPENELCTRTQEGDKVKLLGAVIMMSSSMVKKTDQK